MSLVGLRGACVGGLIAACLCAGPEAAWAPVPPKNCGDLTENGKLFNIKSDQLRCRRARRYSRRFLGGEGKPRGYSCKTYGRETAIKFRCSKGARVFFAIRR